MENWIGIDAAWALKIAELVGMVLFVRWTFLHIKD